MHALLNHLQIGEDASTTQLAASKFEEAFVVVPQLREACASILTWDAAGSGMKHMRLVNKQLRTAMLCLVKGFTLCLGTRGRQLNNEISLLKDSRFLELRVNFAPESAGAFHWLCLQTFCEALHLSQEGIWSDSLGKLCIYTGPF